MTRRPFRPALSIPCLQLATALALSGHSAASAQMTQSWVRSHEGTPCRVLLASDGDIIVGATDRVPSQISGVFRDGIIARYSPSGTLRWIWQSGESRDDTIADIALDAAGNIYAVGEYGTSFWGQSPFATRVMKFSATGQPLWTSAYTANRAGFAAPPEGVRVAPDGSVYVFGQDYGIGTERDVYIARYTSGGSHQWTFRRAGPVWDFIFDIEFDAGSNAYWAGSSFRPGTSLNGACAGRLSPSGQQDWIWLQPLAPNVGGNAGDLSIDHAGDIVITGHTETFPGFQDGLLAKITTGGEELYFTTWDGPDQRWDRFFAHAILPDNSIAVSGDTYAGDGAEYYDVPTIRFSPSGQPLWTDIYGSTLYYPNDTEEWSLNMFSIAGGEILTISTDWARPGYDYALHRYSADGALLERVVRELPAGSADIKDIPRGAAVYDAAASAVYILGWGAGPSTNPAEDHYTLIRVQLPTPVIEGDVDGDGHVTLTDLALLLGTFGLCAGDAGFNAAADFDAGGCVELGDLAVLLANFGT